MNHIDKLEYSLHDRARDLITLGRPLTAEEVEFTLTHWAGLTPTGTRIASLLTPFNLALALSYCVDANQHSVINICAGIGTLAAAHRILTAERFPGNTLPDIVCVEENADYIKIGQRVLPDATWVHANLADVPNMGLGTFDVSICHPPPDVELRDTHEHPETIAEYRAIAIAAQISRAGVFLLPQPLVPFRYSGELDFTVVANNPYEKFRRSTGIELNETYVDTSPQDREWRGIAPRTEIVTADFTKFQKENLCERRTISGC